MATPEADVKRDMESAEQNLSSTRNRLQKVLEKATRAVNKGLAALSINESAVKTTAEAIAEGAQASAELQAIINDPRTPQGIIEELRQISAMGKLCGSGAAAAKSSFEVGGNLGLQSVTFGQEADRRLTDVIEHLPASKPVLAFSAQGKGLEAPSTAGPAVESDASPGSTAKAKI